MHPLVKKRVLNITSKQIDQICSREELALNATRTLLERVAIYNDKWSGQGCNLNRGDLKKFYDGAGITLQRYTHELGPPKKEPAKIKE